MLDRGALGPGGVEPAGFHLGVLPGEGVEDQKVAFGVAEPELFVHRRDAVFTGRRGLDQRREELKLIAARSRLANQFIEEFGAGVRAVCCADRGA